MGYEQYDDREAKRRESEDRDYRDFDRHSRKVGLRLFGWSATTVVAVFLLIVLVGVLGWFWAPWKGAKEARDLTQGSGSYRIAAYDEFFNSCEAIAAKERIIERYVEDLKTAEGSQKAVIQAAITAERNARDELIADYNADAAKEDTRGAFRDSGLPYEIDPEGVTTCSE